MCVHVHMYHMYVYFFMFMLGALSDFDGDYAPEIGTEDPLRTSCRRTSSQNPIALKIGLKVAADSAATFKPIFKAIGSQEDVCRHDVRGGSSVPISGA